MCPFRLRAYIGEQAELLRSQLYGMLPKGKKSQALDDFYRLLLPAVKDFHHAAFGNVASHILEHDGIIKAVVSENWDIREIHVSLSQGDHPTQPFLSPTSILGSDAA